MSEKICSRCILWSTGINDPKGQGYCYSERDYKAEDDTCPFWEKSLRSEPVNSPEVNQKEDL